MKRIALSVAATALLVAGCGGGSDSLTKASLIKQANAICLKYSKKGQDLGQPNLTDPKAAQRYFQQAGDLAQSQVDELQALKPGDTEKSEYGKLTSAYDDAVKLLSGLADAAGNNDKAAGAKLIVELTPISQSVDDAALAVGAASCASNAG